MVGGGNENIYKKNGEHFPLFLRKEGKTEIYKIMFYNFEILIVHYLINSIISIYSVSFARIPFNKL